MSTSMILRRPTVFPPRARCHVQAVQVGGWQGQAQRQGQSRSLSNSPYGRSHLPVKQRRPLPPPVVPHYAQTIHSSDGSTFTHYTTSPLSAYKLARDIHNNPLFTPGDRNVKGGEDGEEGRTGRFRRRFGATGRGDGGERFFAEGGVDWLDQMSQEWGPEAGKAGKEEKK